MTDEKKLLETLHPLERKVFPLLTKLSSFEDIVRESGLQNVEVMRALQWLQNKKLITYKENLTALINLEKNGIVYKEKGLPESRFLHAIKGSTSTSDIKKSAELDDQEVSVSLGLLRRNDWITIEKKDNALFVSLTKKGEDAKAKGLVEEEFLKKSFPLPQSTLSHEEKSVAESLKKRKNLLTMDLKKAITVSLTPLGKKMTELKIDSGIHDRLTPSLIKSGSWKKTKLRRYDVKINVPPIFGGKRHFVTQATDYIKRIWLDLGFEEMEGNMVQTAFWDLDALFVPQDHPAREEQDTFYLKDPATGKIPKALAKKIKDMHEHGGTLGSTGWKYKWSEDVARQNLLRTHTTVLSAQTIAKLKMEDLPAKFFSVNRVFRNEALSWKHLFEFIQVEGIVVDPNANFKNLKGYLREFFQKMGFADVRIRPAHFPYTEPSAEVDVWHPRKKQWVELGGSGIFRPEVVQPLLGKDVPVLAWGLGMERSIMEYYGLTDIRDVYGNNLKQLRNSKAWLK